MLVYASTTLFETKKQHFTHLKVLITVCKVMYCDKTTLHIRDFCNIYMNSLRNASKWKLKKLKFFCITYIHKVNTIKDLNMNSFQYK